MKKQNKQVVYDFDSVSDAFNDRFMSLDEKSAAIKEIRQLVIQHFLTKGKCYDVESYSNPKILRYNTGDISIFDRLGRRISKLCVDVRVKTGKKFRDTFTEDNIQFDVKVDYDGDIDIKASEIILDKSKPKKEFSTLVPYTSVPEEVKAIMCFDCEHYDCCDLGGKITRYCDISHAALIDHDVDTDNYHCRSRIENED